MSRKIDITVDGLSKKAAESDAEPYEDLVWPTMLEDDGSPLGSFVFTFFRGDTKWSPEMNDGEGGWIPIPDWTGPLTEKGRMKWAENSTGLFNLTVEDIDFVYMGNDFLLNSEQLQAEYGPNASDPWNRMPLDIVTQRESSNKRWTYFQGALNIRMRLVKDKDTTQPKFDVSPDLMKDENKKGNWRFVDQSDPQKPDEYHLRGLVISTNYGLEVKEVGTKSLCHYVGQRDPGRSELSYDVDWLEPEGIFVCPFNTLDTDNYKITREPDYEADPVDGRILQPLGKTNVEIYFVFRRWAYYCRIPQIRYELVHQSKEHLYNVGYTEWGNALCGGCDHRAWDYPDSGCGRFQASCGINPLQYPHVMIDCSRTCTDTGTFRDQYWGIQCFNWSSTVVYGWQDGGCHVASYSTQESDLYDCGYPDPCDICYVICNGSGSYTYKITFPNYYRYYGNSYIGLWWGPPPVDWSLTDTSETTKQALFLYRLTPEGSDQGITLGLIGDESYDEAVQHFIDAGGDQEKVDEILAGYNSLHYFAPSEWAKIRVQNPHAELPDDVRALLSRFCSTADGKILTEESVGGLLSYRGTTDKLGALWRHFEGSEFFQTYWKPNDGYAGTESGYCTRNPWKDIPYGVGVSPMREGALCAIIKARGKPYYVWRKTDEEFTERLLHVAGPQMDKPFVSFEGVEGSRCYEFYIHFSGEGRKNTHILASKQAVCGKYNDYGLPDPGGLPPELEGCDQRIPFIESGAGQVELESPVYPIVSRERAVPGEYHWRLLRNEVFYPGTFSANQRDRY